MKAYFLPEELREELRKPLGILIKEEAPASVDRLSKLAQIFSPPIIIAVGDVVAKNLISGGMRPKVVVIDRKTRRKEALEDPLVGYARQQAKNPPAHITDDVWTKLGGAIAGESRVVVIVSGEEDLVAIPAILLAPEGAFVVYGLPGEGMVVVKCDTETRSHANALLGQFHRVEIQDIR